MRRTRTHWLTIGSALAALSLGGAAVCAERSPGAAGDPGADIRLSQAPVAGDANPAENKKAATGVSVGSLIGSRIIDAKGIEIATVSDVVMGPAGQVRKVIVDIGGFLGIGAKSVALDLASLQIEQGVERGLATTLERRELEALPEYVKVGEVWRPKPASR